MSQIRDRQWPTFLVIILTAFSVAAYALPEDSKEILHIKADTTIYNYKKGVNYFEGHVQIDQGTTHVTADRLTTKDNDKHQIPCTFLDRAATRGQRS
jgi:lipopolysaccharide export system protein LptA